LIKERKENGNFVSIEDLCERTGKDMPNKRTLESMIKVGAFDELGYRQNLLDKLDTAIAVAQKAAHLKDIGQTTFFDIFSEATPSQEKLPVTETLSGQNETSLLEQLTWERELLGMHLSITPVDHAISKYHDSLLTLTSEIDPENGQRVTAGGMVSNIQYRVTQNGKPFVTASIELQDGPLEIVIWDHKEITSATALLNPGQFICVVGQPRMWRNSLSMTTENIYPIELDGTINESAFSNTNVNEEQQGPTRPPMTPNTQSPKPLKEIKTVVVRIFETGDPTTDKQLLYQVMELLIEFEGPDQVQLEIQTSSKAATMAFDQISTNYCPDLVQKMQDLLGDQSLTLKVSESRINLNSFGEVSAADLAPSNV